jgi:hypoxanthine phosphoribosyltransferase
MDFADTGASLYQLKKDVKKLRPQAAVQTAAIGKSEMLDKEVNKKYKDDLDLIVTGIDSLQKDLREQRLKYYVVGRNKKKNPYAEWSSKNVKLERRALSHRERRQAGDRESAPAILTPE